MLFKKISFSEISEIIRKNLNNIDAKRIIKYSLRTENIALIKRLGFLLDALGKDFFNEVGNLTTSYIPLDYAMPGDGIKNKKWRIIENVGF